MTDGLKVKHLPESQDYEVDDHWLTTRAETDAFKAGHGVKTAPQTFVGGKRILEGRDGAHPAPIPR